MPALCVVQVPRDEVTAARVGDFLQARFAEWRDGLSDGAPPFTAGGAAATSVPGDAGSASGSSAEGSEPWVYISD